MKHLSKLFAALCFGMVSASSHAQAVERITYGLDGGNLHATEYDPMFFMPEPLQAHNVSMEPVSYNDGDEGVLTLGWNMEQDYDSSRFVSLRVNVAPGYVFHQDSVTLKIKGISWQGPTIAGVRVLVDDDPLQGGYCVGWQVFDSVISCTVSMWYMIPPPYDTLVNYWQINARHHIELQFYAWSSIPDTLGNIMPETGWIIDDIELHGKVVPDLSTSLPEVSSLDLSSVGTKPVEIYGPSGQLVANRMSYLQEALPGAYVVRQGSQTKRVVKME